MSILSLDTETTGLFIHKGCRAFTVSACSSDNKIYLWHFPVDPFTREVQYTPSVVKDLLRVIRSHETLVFHHANFDLQVLSKIDPALHWSQLYVNHDIHDTMVMSHAYRSSDRHGLKENAVLYLGYPDDDEKELGDITQKARTQAKKLKWAWADGNNLHTSLVGTQDQFYKCDYWIPKQIAIELGYPLDHRWRHICDEYAGKDAERTIALYYFFDEVLKTIPHESKYNKTHTGLEYTGTLYDKYNEARQLIYPLLDMQTTGIPVKPKALADAHKEYTELQTESLQTLRRYAKDPEFNPRSPLQLSALLFQKLGFEPMPGKVGANGPSTDKDVLSYLLTKAPVRNNTIPGKYKFIITLKEYRKQTTTRQYLEAYSKHSDNAERTLQPFFSQTRTGTGRLSCENPNTTNVGKKDMSNPFADAKGNDAIKATIFSEILGIDTDHKFSLRNVFGPKRGHIWTCIDYDQFQLRIFAVVSESHELIESFARGDDVHMTVARIIFNKSDISDTERTAAKAINFGLLFGAGPEKIELLAGVPGLYKMFMDNFPKAKKYLNDQSRIAREKGYVHTVGGYRLYVPRNAPHAASCYVIQGTEAEIVKRAMVSIHPHYASFQRSRRTWEDRTYRLLMMIHDELVLTSTDHDYDELSLIMNAMEQAGLQLGIPCKVDAKITTTNWATRKSLQFERVPC
jgi:DNA polymerase I-like protein with 3'-5' exonuclease and polymerase domains